MSRTSLNAKKLKTYRKHNLNENLSTLLRREFNLSDTHMQALVQHMRFIRGGVWADLDGSTTDLTESMSDFYNSDDPEMDEALQQILWDLREKGLVYKRHGHRGRVYYDLSDKVWELVEQRFNFDGGEKARHRRAVGLVRTLFGAIKRCDVVPYASLPVGGQVDAVVYQTLPQDAPDSIEDLDAYGEVRDPILETRLEAVKARERKRARRESWPPGERPIAVEVMTDHHDTQGVLERYDDIAIADYDGLWVFPDRETMNKWIRRLANPQAEGEEPRFESPYEWSSTTPIDTAQERIERMDLDGMAWVTTVDRLEQRINAVEDKEAKLRRAPPAHLVDRDNRQSSI